MSRVVPAIAALALSSASLVAPAYAGGPQSNKPSGDDKPEVLNLHVKETEKFGKKELCRFPVAIKLHLHVRDVITNGGDDVHETVHGKVKVTNLWTHESMHFRVDAEAFIKVSEDGHSIRGVSSGKSLLYNDDIKVYSRHQGHVSAANRGHQEDEGIYYIDGKSKFVVEGVDDPGNESSRVYVKKGHVLDVCKALAPHHHHHDKH